MHYVVFVEEVKIRKQVPTRKHEKKKTIHKTRSIHIMKEIGKGFKREN